MSWLHFWQEELIFVYFLKFSAEKKKIEWGERDICLALALLLARGGDVLHYQSLVLQIAQMKSSFGLPDKWF